MMGAKSQKQDDWDRNADKPQQHRTHDHQLLIYLALKSLANRLVPEGQNEAFL